MRVVIDDNMPHKEIDLVRARLKRLRKELNR